MHSDHLNSEDFCGVVASGMGLGGVVRMRKWHYDRAAEAASLLSMLGNGKRLAIVSELVDKELSVGAIAERVPLSQSALSQHLAKLRKYQVVETRRDRQTIYYACRSERVKRLLRTLEEIYQPTNERA